MKRLIVLAILLWGFIGCGGGLSKPDKQEEPLTLIITSAPCPEGYERARENGPNGMMRVGCYPIDFDYNKANEKITKYIIDKECSCK